MRVSFADASGIAVLARCGLAITAEPATCRK
jgi:hypothetical protein